MFDIRVFAAVLLACAALLPTAASADSPPDMPLPPCIYTEGKFYGACPAESDEVTGSGDGRFVAGGTVLVTTVPSIPVCDSMSTYTYLWSPSGCYAEVFEPVIVNCVTIDLTDGERFRELPCAQALYRSTQDLPTPLFTMIRPAENTGWRGRTACGDTPSYSTYFYGGPATDPTAVWRARGPLALECLVQFVGPRRPDGLYGPTWVKIRVQIRVGEDGLSPFGRLEWAEFYVPIDGDMRTTPDIAVSGSAVLSSDWSNGRLLATYTVKLENTSNVTMEDVKLTAGLSSFLMAQSVSDSNCRLPGIAAGETPPPNALRKTGGALTCEWPSLAAKSTITLDFVARILNATDFDAIQKGIELSTFTAEKIPGVELTATAANDHNHKNDTAIVKVDIPFRPGSYEHTEALMAVLDSHFNYKTLKFLQGCNSYKEDIYERLDAIRTEHPEVFSQLSFGDITSGDYDIPGWTHASGNRAGHVGVVVYEKGTNYRETGIVIHGTPTWSPLNTVSQVGANSIEHALGLTSFTAISGLYFRTRAKDFPGTPQQEAKRGFEGPYGNNKHEFTVGGAVPAPTAPESETFSCPVAPDAMTIRTESPVDLIVTNSRGQRIETQGGVLIAQELDEGIVSMAFPHEDGTFGWHLALPVDDYDVQLRGTREGTYTLTLTTYSEDGEPIDEVTTGTTAPGQVEQYKFGKPATSEPTTPTTPMTPTTPATPGAQQTSVGKGGGGALDMLALMTALSLLIARRRMR